MSKLLEEEALKKEEAAKKPRVLKNALPKSSKAAAELMISKDSSREKDVTLMLRELVHFLRVS